MSRYHLIEVGCLECSFDADSDPVLIMATDDLVEPMLMVEETKHSHSVDRFVFDSILGTIITRDREETR